MHATGPEPEDIEARTLRYGVRAVHVFRALQGGADRAGWVVGKQFLRSATSVGANVAEARAAESKRDFVHKIQLAQKEARESLYWLRLLAETGILPPAKLAAITQETDEVLRILIAIARNTKRNASSDGA